MRSGFMCANIDPLCARSTDFRRSGRGVGVVLLAALLVLLGGELWRGNAQSHDTLRSPVAVTNHLPRSQPVAVPADDSAPFGAAGPLELEDGPAATPTAPPAQPLATVVSPSPPVGSIAAFRPGDRFPRAPPPKV